MASTLDATVSLDFHEGPAASAWEALEAHLARRADELRAEVRDYPTPIAGCDVQLAKLLEQRGAAIAAVNRMRRFRSAGSFPAREAVEAVVADAPATDEMVEEQLRLRLRATLFALPCRD